jgi:hypothetical protein
MRMEWVGGIHEDEKHMQRISLKTDRAIAPTCRKEGDLKETLSGHGLHSSA